MPVAVQDVPSIAVPPFPPEAAESVTAAVGAQAVNATPEKRDYTWAPTDS